MTIPFYLVDAFSTESFKGNPAAVCVLKEWLDDDTLLKMAKEHNQSETAFIIAKKKDDEFEIRWFTSQDEVDLCGHATLGSSHVIFTEGLAKSNTITLYTQKVGNLVVTRDGQLLTMDLPLRAATEVAKDRHDISKYIKGLGLSGEPKHIFETDRDIYFELSDAETVRRIKPDFTMLAECEKWVGITAYSGNEYDCVSRFFTPGDSHEEDPVTGSAHCTIAPYWMNKLQKNIITAYQASERGGVLNCKLKGDRVFITGQAKTYLKGKITP